MQHYYICMRQFLTHVESGCFLAGYVVWEVHTKVQRIILK